MSPTNYRQLCIEIFGTDDEATIRKLVEAWKKKNNRNAGRKKALSERDLAEAQTMLCSGVKIQSIADHFGVSRKIVSQALNDRPGENFTMRIDYKQRNRICTVIYVDFLEKQILIQNRTDDVLDRAFGVIEEPTWKDFEQFLLSRCFPQSRGYAKAILQNLGVQSYDPLEIAEVTGGRTAEDNMYLTFKNYPREVNTYAKNQADQGRSGGAAGAHF